MSANKIELKTIGNLSGMTFVIPAYQRGYRWTEQQVKDLLNDVYEFEDRDNGFYCLQPLVVIQRTEDTLKKIKEEAQSLKEVENLLRGKWEVIDGQQRLTTIHIILTCLGIKNLYTIEYETRKGSQNFLNNINDTEGKDNIDFFHFSIAKNTIEEWLTFQRQKDSNFDIASFSAKLENSVKFIWYEAINENPIKVFTRLNIGKISLTNSELIKALFLNQSNFHGTVTLRQQQVALEWDQIEYALQNDEMWLFLNDVGYDRPTRIDYIFDLICNQDKLKLFVNKTDEQKEEIRRSIGTDNYKTFRYFYEYFKLSEGDKIKYCWSKVKIVFDTFDEWFRDLELYHYTGYLIANNISVTELLQEWESPGMTKTKYVSYLKDKIRNKIKGCSVLDAQYEIEKEDGKGHFPSKTTCRPLLLLHNIQTIVTQASNSQKEYQGQVFYKFPFHLYKIEKWDVEHIDSNTLNPLVKDKDQKDWLKFALLDETIANDDSLVNDIVAFINDKHDAIKFSELREKIENIHSNVQALTDKEKNQIWNFALLDSNTNRGYGNAIFPVKRRCIIGKDQGVSFSIEIEEINGKNFNVISRKSSSSFIPPCTKYAFLKYYNSVSASISYWDKNDAIAYRKNMLETLKEFNVVLKANNNNE